MKARIFVFLAALVWTISVNAGERHLIYFTLAPDYVGAGFQRAFSGIDATGPLIGLEVGSSMNGHLRGQVSGGWRLVHGRLVATFAGGLEFGDRLRPLGDVDVWWDRGRLMAKARAKVTEDYVDWRVALGARRLEASGAWYGPELLSHGGKPRYGVHATGIALPGRVRGRISGGYEGGGVYGEISFWRRF